jgi:hypothetical protein
MNSDDLQVFENNISIRFLIKGLRQSGCELIQKYLDQTSDIRTAALLAIYVPEDVHQECPYVQEWIEG